MRRFRDIQFGASFFDQNFEKMDLRSKILEFFCKFLESDFLALIFLNIKDAPFSQGQFGAEKMRRFRGHKDAPFFGLKDAPFSRDFFLKNPYQSRIKNDSFSAKTAHVSFPKTAHLLAFFSRENGASLVCENGACFAPEIGASFFEKNFFHFFKNFEKWDCKKCKRCAVFGDI